MPDQDDRTTGGNGAATAASPSVTVPPDLQKQYPDLIDLILKSESMDDEERQYWINILPVMTSEQRENLRTILLSEREQLQAIERKYQKEVEKLSSQEMVARMEQKRREARTSREMTEGVHEEEEQRAEEEILKKIQENE